MNQQALSKPLPDKWTRLTKKTTDDLVNQST